METCRDAVEGESTVLIDPCVRLRAEPAAKESGRALVATISMTSPLSRRTARAAASTERTDGSVGASNGELVPAALSALDRGGTLAIAGIHLSDIPALNYAAQLFQERTLRSVTANTRGDAEEFLRLAQRLRLRVTVTPYRLEQADQALADLAADRVAGAAVLSA